MPPVAKNSVQMVRAKIPKPENDALLKLDSLSAEFLDVDFHATISTQVSSIQPYITALMHISEGISYFDAQGMLVLSNKKYEELFGLRPEDVSPGMTLRDLAALRLKAGTLPKEAVEHYVGFYQDAGLSGQSSKRTYVLCDGRSICENYVRTSDGGVFVTHSDVTKLENDSISLQTLIDWVPDFLWIKDVSRRFIIANTALAANSGRASSKEMIGLSDFDIHAPDRALEFSLQEQAMIASGEPSIAQEEVVISSTGTERWISSTKVPVKNADGKVFGLLGIARDITLQKHEQEIRAGRVEVLELIASGAPVKDILDKLIHLAEHKAPGIAGSILLLEPDGLHLRHTSAPGLPESYLKAINGVRIGPSAGSCGTAAFRGERVIVSDIRTDPLWDEFRALVTPYGYKSCWSTPILSQQGSVLGVFAMYSKTAREPSAAELGVMDITVHFAGIAIQRKINEDRIEYMANHDALTGLPNRALLNDRLAQAISFANRYGRGVSVVFIDLDNFKPVNDCLGHPVGDEILKTVASRMLKAVRSTDTVVRLGGDEFVIILFDQIQNIDSTISTLQKITNAISEPIFRGKHKLLITASIGVATYPDDGSDAIALLANADAAMYRAKELGRNNFQFYTPELNKSVHEKFELQEELRGALGRAEFALHYQPQIDLASGKIFAVEALIRWYHPRLGTISPDKFIPIAEETGLIVQIGEWVLHTACMQNKAWQDAGLAPIRVCVNVSARQFREKNLVHYIKNTLMETGLASHYLELEVTESLIMQDVTQAVATMKELQELGIQLAIDDFGTGYSSLSALKDFPVARLKIDKTFVDEILTNESDKAVVSAVISLAHNLKMKVIAEGVETAGQLAFLRSSNCDEVQGYHFSRPVSPGDIGLMLKAAD